VRDHPVDLNAPNLVPVWSLSGIVGRYRLTQRRNTTGTSIAPSATGPSQISVANRRMISIGRMVSPKSRGRVGSRKEESERVGVWCSCTWSFV
jgi:hypothetical protein